jgi:shikimate dehydrogenase
MKRYGLIGYPLSHSWSPNYFNQKFAREGVHAEYRLFPLKAIADFPNLLKQQNLTGLNVTIPYKQAIIPYLDELSGEAKAIGAVNTIVFQDDRLIGYNTDVYGFAATLDESEVPKRVHALLLGTGGASKAVQYVLQQRNIPCTLVSRKRTPQAMAYSDLTNAIIQGHQLVINCTPVGMYPNISDCPEIPYQGLSESHWVIDLIYNPTETIFLQRAAAKKARTTGGLHMLQQQANKAWQLWQAK